MKKASTFVDPGMDLAKYHGELEKALDRALNDPEYVAELQSEKVGNPMTLGPRVVDAEAWTEDMTTAAKNKSAKWLANSLKPRKDPKDRARKAAKKYQNNMEEALREKRWDKGIDAYDETVRQETIAAVGEAGFSRGIDTKKGKIAHKIGKLQPLVAAMTETLDKMPVDTSEQRAAKMIAARDGMIAVKKKMREG
jgi:hypothetical protein